MMTLLILQYIGVFQRISMAKKKQSPSYGMVKSSNISNTTVTRNSDVHQAKYMKNHTFRFSIGCFFLNLSRLIKAFLNEF